MTWRFSGHGLPLRQAEALAILAPHRHLIEGIERRLFRHEIEMPQVLDRLRDWVAR